jgi:transcriptional regulator with XRE-family HTH domain
MKCNIDKYLKEAGMTQRELAERIGTTEVSVSRYISGSRVPKAPVCIQIAEVLNCKVEDLYSTEDLPKNMAEKEALKTLKELTFDAKSLECKKINSALEMAIQALEEMQKIKELGDCYIIPKNSTWEVNGIDIHKAIEDIQAYRAIGTVEELQAIKSSTQLVTDILAEYSSIGTIEAFKALKGGAK